MPLSPTIVARNATPASTIRFSLYTDRPPLINPLDARTVFFFLAILYDTTQIHHARKGWSRQNALLLSSNLRGLRMEGKKECEVTLTFARPEARKKKKNMNNGSRPGTFCFLLLYPIPSYLPSIPLSSWRAVIAARARGWLQWRKAAHCIAPTDRYRIQVSSFYNTSPTILAASLYVLRSFSHFSRSVLIWSSS